MYRRHHTRRGCAVCCGEAGGLAPNPTGCPCCGPDDADSDPRDGWCGGYQHCPGCGGCSVSRTMWREVTARAPRSPAGIRRRKANGILVGDRILVLRGFHYQRGGPRVYVEPEEHMLARGPAWVFPPPPSAPEGSQ